MAGSEGARAGAEGERVGVTGRIAMVLGDPAYAAVEGGLAEELRALRAA